MKSTKHLANVNYYCCEGEIGTSVLQYACSAWEMSPTCTTLSFSVTTFIQHNWWNVDSTLSERSFRVKIHRSLPHLCYKIQPILASDFIWPQSIIKKLAEARTTTEESLDLHLVSTLFRRHMLLFTAHSPVGHAIHICSMVTFVIGDEDVVLPNFEPVNWLATVICVCVL